MQKTFETSGAVSLDLRIPSGEVIVDATLEGRVELELTADDEESQALVDAARIDFRGDSLLVDIPSKGRGFSIGFFFGRHGITCRVRCPATSSLEARTKSADVSTRGPLGDVAVSTASGDVQVRHAGGDLIVKTASGDIEAGHVSGDLTANTASGDVKLGLAAGESRVVTVSGDQHHEAVSVGNVSTQSVSGDIVIAVRRGSRAYLDCNTLSGDTSSELDMTGEPAADGPLIEIKAKTVSGDIRITRAPAAPGPPADTTREVHA